MPVHHWRHPTASLVFGLVAAAGLHAPAQAFQADELEAAVRAEINESGIQMNPADRDFLSFAIDHSRMLTEALRLATERSPTPQIRALADTMHETHVALTAGLLDLSGDTAPNRTRIADHEAVLALAEVPVDRFDEHFVRVLQQAHQEGMHAYAATSIDDSVSERVRALAEQSLPILQYHEALIDEAAIAWVDD